MLAVMLPAHRFLYELQSAGRQAAQPVIANSGCARRRVVARGRAAYSKT
jgi:hypothetical protein